MHTPWRWIRTGLMLAVVAAGGVPALLGAQGDTAAARAAAQRPSPREEWQRVTDIFEALGARDGSRVADVGAGEGWLTTRLARHVGPTGRVFAVDISENAVRSLRRTIEAQGLANVETILSEEDDPRLPYGSLDGIVVLNAYHEMVVRVAMLDGFKRALKPGGLLVIVDNAPRDSTAMRQQQVAQHQLALAYAEDDLVASGFEIVRRDASFIEHVNPAMANRQWLLVARRAAR